MFVGLAGPLSSVMAAGGYFLANHIKHQHGDAAFNYALGVHVVCWLAQFYGHGVHEGNSPALLDNLFQAIFTAPLFVVMEILFIFGYKRSFRDRVQKEVDEKRAKWAADKLAGSKKRS